MSTGNSGDVFQFTGDDNLRRQGNDFQFTGDGPSRFQEEGWDIPRGATANYSFPMDRQGFPVINNYGTMNIFMAGGNGYDDASCRAMQAAKLNDMMSGRYDNYDDSYRQEWENSRLSDMRRQALIRDGQNMDRMIRSYYSPDMDPQYGRQFNDYAYRRPGQYTNYSHGGPDGLTYYESGPSYSRNQPWMNDDCFGTGGGNGDWRAFNDVLRTTLPAVLAFKYADRNHRNHGGRWERGYDNGYGGMNPIELMLMERAINGDRYGWGRNPRMYSRNDVAYSHGGPDGLSYFNSTPTYDQYMGPRSGFERTVDDVLPIAQTVLPAILAFKYADQDRGRGDYRVPQYRSRHNTQQYYGDNGSYQMAYNRGRHNYLAQQRADEIAYNRQRAYERRMYS